MKIESDIEIDLQQMRGSGRYDPLIIVSLCVIAVSVMIIAMTVSIMLS